MNISRQYRFISLFCLVTMLFPITSYAQEKFSRNIENISFVPKGQWIGGVSVNYSQSDQNNYQFLIFEKISGDTYTFKVSPMLLYAFKDNLAMGGRFAYSRSRTRLESADVVLDSETDYNVDNLYSITHSYSRNILFPPIYVARRKHPLRTA